MSETRWVKRIPLVGDSYLWGCGVDDRFVLSEIFQERVERKVEVINDAVTGYGTYQEFLTTERAGANFLLLFLPNKEFETGDPVGYDQMVGYGREAYDISANFLWNAGVSEYLHRLTKKCSAGESSSIAHAPRTITGARPAIG